MVVPEEDLVHGELGMRAAADEGEDVAAEEHLDYAYAAVEVLRTSQQGATYLA